MGKELYLELAARGHRVPIGTHLVLHQQSDPEQVLLDAGDLGRVVIETARRFVTPLAMPLMDLTLEKAALLAAMGVPASEVEGFHLMDCGANPSEIPLTPRMLATCGAIAQVARVPDLLPMGMCIGPFSLTTKLLSDPITPVFMAGTGLSAADEPEIAVLEHALALSLRVVTTYVRAQLAAGAKAIIVCEPAANLVYFSPRQLEQGHEVFDRLVMEPMRVLTAILREADADLVFHDCGELTEGMVRRFATLGAAMVSLGSSRTLWEDAAFFPKDTVLYGNLPTKRFFSRQLSVAEVGLRSRELVECMRSVGHPFILGSECDVLSVPGAEEEILSKVDAFLRPRCHSCS